MSTSPTKQPSSPTPPPPSPSPPSSVTTPPSLPLYPPNQEDYVWKQLMSYYTTNTSPSTPSHSPCLVNTNISCSQSQAACYPSTDEMLSLDVTALDSEDDVRSPILDPSNSVPSGITSTPDHQGQEKVQCRAQVLRTITQEQISEALFG